MFSNVVVNTQIIFVIATLWLVIKVSSSQLSNDKLSSASKQLANNQITFDRPVDSSNSENFRPNKCVPIAIPMCKNIGYNLTYMPNEFHHETQEEAGLVVHQFYPLVEIACSENLRLFLCSMYAPICLPNWPKRIRACRSVCESARDGCAPVMNTYGFKWPKSMDCDKLTEDQACLKKDTKNVTKPQKSNGCDCKCRHPYILDNKPQFNSVITGGVHNCFQSCHSANFVSVDKSFVTFWIGLWAVLCCISSTATVFTFLLDRSRFKYPERPIVFLSGCYMMVSTGYIIRVAMGHELIACENNRLRYGTTGPARCSVVFLLIYFFGMAASVWWVILTVTWFLSAGLKWGSEAIAKYSEIFHFMAWFLSGAKSILALTFVAIDGDPIAGICYIGNTNPLHLKLFLIAPLLVYLLTGSCFLLSGFVALISIRKTIRAKGETKTDKLEKLMMRIGIFGLLYSVPAAVVIGCHIYELKNRELWERSINCLCPRTLTEDVSFFRPEYSIFMLKYFMCLVVGITSGFWIWTTKTLDSWNNAFRQVGRALLGKPRKNNSAKHFLGTEQDTPLCQMNQKQMPVIVSPDSGMVTQNSLMTQATHISNYSQHQADSNGLNHIGGGSIQHHHFIHNANSDLASVSRV
uniref:Fzd-5/8-4 n=1 Tax=Dendrocoelum lacteum TaxID=27895 RepID=T1E109_9PLAT